jgi:HK97 family phage major capsid protein
MYDRVLKADANRQQIAREVVRLNDEDKFDEALALQPKLESANAEYEAANRLYLAALAATSNNASDPAQRFIPLGGDQPQPQPSNLRASPEYMNEWLTAFRNGVTPRNVHQAGGSERYPHLINALTETGGTPAGEEGGFLNPVDFDNAIRELMREYVDLGEHVNVEDVTTLTGWRVIEQFAAAQPLTETTTELHVKADAEEGESPKFNKIDFALKEYSDFLRVSNNLLADTPVNLFNYLARWFARKVVLTHNALILAKVNAISGTNVSDATTLLKTIKTALNKTLDPAFSATAEIWTNQSGLDLLDQLTDSTGRPMLQPDPSAPTAYRVMNRQIVVLSDAHWPNLSGPARARFAIGNGREYVTLFRRSAFEFASTTVGGSAWRSNSTEVRGIARLNCQQMDAGAMTLLTVTIP